MNGTRDIVFKRCGCTDEVTGRQRPAGQSSTGRAIGPRPGLGRWRVGCSSGWRRPSRTCARPPCMGTATTSTGTSSPAWAASPWPT
jgi:hypothetical protein